MNLRARIALLVGVTVLIASAIGGVGTAITSQGVGRDRLDQELINDAAGFPAGAPQLAAQIQFTFEARRASCEDAITERAANEALDAAGSTGTNAGTDARTSRLGRRARFLPEFASAMQFIRPNGTAVAACETIPISDADTVIAETGVGQNFRTVSIDGERFRILTQGYGDVGAVQFARGLDLTEDTLRGLVVRIVGFGLVGALLAAALGWFWAKRATRPVRTLNAAAERVARTHDLGERIEVRGDDEIGALASSFNSMLTSLDTSREQQRRLVQDASHELRTPLTSMRTNVELLQRHRDIEPELRAQILGDIGAELAELSELTAELVESATEVPANLEITTPVDLVEVVTESVERARRRHRREIALEIGDDPRTVVPGEPMLLGRAVTNLINNAVKFTEAGSAIEVEVAGSSVVVLDRGPGIDEADLTKIFDRFYRATAARSAPGSGLGLAIVKQIVEGHGGTTTAYNRTGGGAAIGFSLPDGAAQVD